MFPTREKKVLIRFDVNQLGPDESRHLLVAGLSKGYGRFRHAKKYRLKAAFSDSSKKNQQVRNGAREGEKCSKQCFHGPGRGFELSKRNHLLKFSVFLLAISTRGADKMKAFLTHQWLKSQRILARCVQPGEDQCSLLWHAK